MIGRLAMQIQANELFDDMGSVAQAHCRWLTGSQIVKAPMEGLTLIQQSINARQPVTIQELISAGIYITFNGESSISKADDVHSIQVLPVYQDTIVDWSVTEMKSFNWVQVFISWEHLAQVTGESIAQAQHFFMRQVSKETGKALDLPKTQALSRDLNSLLGQEGKRLALVGKLYSLVFQLIEHIQVRHHLSQCEGCQKKLFKSQNMLEAGIKTSDADLAQTVGLTLTALELGFVMISGMTLEEYQIEVAIRRALSSRLTHGQSLAKQINADTGLAHRDIEKACLKRFGVMSHQLGSMQ